MPEKATFAAGCFWGVEAKFRKVHGVIDTQVGYAGGKTQNPTYEQVCDGETGHAEAVEVTFDPKITSFKELLDLFWRIHNPTSKNRQGPDIGSQYRSAIFFHNGSQEKIAKQEKERLIRNGQNIVTEVAPAGPFYRAEEYHQRYEERRGGSCEI